MASFRLADKHVTCKLTWTNCYGVNLFTNPLAETYDSIDSTIVRFIFSGVKG